MRKLAASADTKDIGGPGGWVATGVDTLLLGALALVALSDTLTALPRWFTTFMDVLAVVAIVVWIFLHIVAALRGKPGV
jgi:hypothetical protein